MICERCSVEFTPKDKKKGHRYCSCYCANVNRVKVTPASLRPFAEIGAHIKVIAHKLGVAYASVRCALIRYGLYALWKQNRFKKCVSLTAGSASASTASAMAITPSSGLVALTAGGTSYGS